MDINDVKSIMGAIASDGRVGYQTMSGLPFAQTICRWRAVNRGVIYRNAENKDVAKIAAENYEHVATFSEALEHVGRDFPGIFQDADLLWNIDETKVSCEYGRKRNVFGGSQSNHGGFVASRAAKMKKHITAVVAVSASGHKAPPFFIIAGKNVMTSWFTPLTEEEFTEHVPSLFWLTSQKWWPDGSLFMTSENGSMERKLSGLLLNMLTDTYENLSQRTKPFV